jgi:hypothetical protein
LSIDEERGRPLAKGRVIEGDDWVEPERGREKEKDRIMKSALDKFGGFLGLDGEENKESGDGWKEFKAGAYIAYLNYSDIDYFTRNIKVSTPTQFPLQFLATRPQPSVAPPEP